MELRTIVPPGTATPSPGGGEGSGGGEGEEKEGGREGTGSIYSKSCWQRNDRMQALITEVLAHLRW